MEIATHQLKTELPNQFEADNDTKFKLLSHSNDASCWFYIDSGAWSAKGVRKHLEDEHLIVPSLRAAVPSLAGLTDLGLYAVLDGHGGKFAVTYAKDNLTTELASQINSLTDEETKELPFSDSTVRKILTNTCEKLDTGIATGMSNCKDGCTAAILITQASYVWVGTLGDAAAFLCMKDASDTIHAVPLSEGHKPWVIKEKERIVKCGGMVENGRVNGTLAVTRCLGDIHLKRYGVLSVPTLSKFKVTQGRDAFVLMGCDGFWMSWSALDAVKKASEFLKKEQRRIAIAGAEPPVTTPTPWSYYTLFGVIHK